MASGWFPTALLRMGAPGTLGTTASDSIDLVDDNIYAALIDTAVADYNAANVFLSSYTAAIIGTPVALTGKALAVSGGQPVFDANDVTFASVAAGSTVGAVLLFKQTGLGDGTCPNVAWLRSDALAGLSVSTNGQDINLLWSASGILGLGGLAA